MTRLVTAVGLLAVLGGCTSVKMVQRDGCWIRQTQQKPFGGTREEIGPCASPATPWAQGDRLTRLVQECAARDDARWQSRALAAWSRGEALPPREADDGALKACLTDSTRAVVTDVEGARRENEALRKELAALTAERDALRARDDEGRTAILATQAKLADHLGEAAKKAQQPAVATAFSTSEHNSETTTNGAAPGAPSLAVLNGAPAVLPATAACAPAAPATAPRASPRPSIRAARARPPERKSPECPPAPEATPGLEPVPATPAAAAAAAGLLPPVPAVAPDPFPLAPLSVAAPADATPLAPAVPVGR